MTSLTLSKEQELWVQILTVPLRAAVMPPLSSNLLVCEVELMIFTLRGL